MTSTDFGFVRDKEDARAVERHLNPLPRSIVRPNEYALLDGEWRFDLDLEDRGLTEKWYVGHEFGRAASWPGSIEAHMAEAKGAQDG